MFSSISRRVNSAATDGQTWARKSTVNSVVATVTVEPPAPFGDPGQPAGKHAARYLGHGLAGGREQVVLAATLLDHQSFPADLLEGAVESVELLADRRVLAA